MYKKRINIKKVDIKRIPLANTIFYCKQGAYEYYVRYIANDGFIPLYIVIPQTNLYTNYMNILANDKEFLKYTEIWNKIKDLSKNLFNKWFNNELIYNNEYVKTKINPFNINFHGNKRPKR